MGGTRVWAVTFTEFGSAETVLVNRVEGTDEFVHLVFADSAYGQAVAAFNEARDTYLSFHVVRTEGTFGPDARAHLVAEEPSGCEVDGCYYCGGGDQVELRPYDVIGG